MICNTTWDNTYASDYKDLTALKALADQYGIAILLVHHLRKEEATDVFNRISGTTGMQGAVDSSFTLVEEKRGSGRATLSCVGRDIEFREIDLEKNQDNVWELKSDSLDGQSKPQDKTAWLIEQLMTGENELRVTPTALAERLNTMLVAGDDTFSNRTVVRRLYECGNELSSLGISFKNYSSNGKRLVSLWRFGGDGDDKMSPTPGTQNIVSIVAGTISPATLAPVPPFRPPCGDDEPAVE